MTINKECLIKSLKTDYWDIGRAAAVCLIICICAYTAFAITSRYVNQIYEGLQLVVNFIMQPMSPINIFIAVELLTMVGILYCTLFVYPDGKSKSEIKEDLKQPITTPITIVISTGSMFVVYIVYSIMVYGAAKEHVTLPDITIIFIGLLALNAFISTPVAVAIARCKE